ncbi:MAG: amidase [Alphaproteobacteria bacterium]|nr:amidase [Alphaproteobacteria bacterium]
MVDVHYRSAKQLASLIRRRAIGCRELLDHLLARAERHNPRLNAIIAFDIERARRDAAAADRALKRGATVGPLHGVPMTIKESFDVEGLPTTWGLEAFRAHKAARDALAVSRFRAAGAILLGKTNVPVWLADWQSFNPVYGTTNNPWDVTRIPGGSSGGSAAALAAGLAGIEAGSDIGASIRNPAHYCGVYGHKPTYGICSPCGQALAGRVSAADISVIGPMARGAADLELGLRVMGGGDAVDGRGWRLALPRDGRKRLRDFRVAVMLDDPIAEVDRAVIERLQALADFLGKQRVKVSLMARPALDTAEVMRVYVALLRAATSGRQTDAQFAANQALARGLAPDDESYLARMTRANTMAHRDWLALNERRHQMRLAWDAFFETWDVLLCPAASSAAHAHDHAGERHERTIMVNGKRVPTTDQLFWAGYSGVAYLPSTVAPCGFTAEGLPVGVQIVGRQYGDLTTIRFAHLLERAFMGFVPPPGWD